MLKKYLFIDQEGVLIQSHPAEYQVGQLIFEKDVVPSLLALQQAGFTLVMIVCYRISREENSGLELQQFEAFNQFVTGVLNSQGIIFESVILCPNLGENNCLCSKPKTDLIKNYQTNNELDIENTYLVSNRQIDIQLAENIGIQGVLYDWEQNNWSTLVKQLTKPNRYASVSRKTNETDITVAVKLDQSEKSTISTGIGFFDHMLDQIATHANISLNISVSGDLQIDDHHTIEDVALALGEALKKTLGNKRGINRFGFVLPMDECLASCALDLSGRPFLKYKAKFRYQKVGGMSTEMMEHFFYSLAYQLNATLHLKTKGKNDHHKAESLFKAFGRTLRQAIAVNGNNLPSSKGIL